MDQSSFMYFMDNCQISEQYTQTGCTILHDTQQNQLVLMKEIDLNQDDQVEDMVDILHKQKELYHEHLLSLIDFYPAINQKKMIKFYEYCSHTLLQQIQSRTQTNSPFSEEELENILVSGLKLLGYLQQAEIGHGCISPLDICLSDDLVKIVDPSIASSNPLSIVEGYYYSPQLLENINNGTQDQIDIFKNDIFSLAVCILHCGLLQSCHDCYDYERGEFIFEVLQQKIGQLNQIYSEKFVKILIKMLDEDPETRPGSCDILLLLQKQFMQQSQQFQDQQQYYEAQNQNFYEYENPKMSYQQQNSNMFESKHNKNFQIHQQPPSIKPPVQNITQSKFKNKQNNCSSINISKTEQRLASMINRAKMNISKFKDNAPKLQ